MATTTVTIRDPTFQNHCSVTVSATETPERKFDFEVTDLCELKTDVGGSYDNAMIRYYCGDGLTYARRRLGLQGGIIAEIKAISGTLAKGSEVAVSLAVAVATAEAIGKTNCAALLHGQKHWVLSTDEREP